MADWRPVDIDLPELIGERPRDPLDRVIEPWHPVPGDRVRVVINGECRHVFRKWDAFGPGYEDIVGHPPEQDGATGTVQDISGYLKRIRAPSVLEHHPYLVRFDGWGGINGVTMAVYSAGELELLDEPQRVRGVWGARK